MLFSNRKNTTFLLFSNLNQVVFMLFSNFFMKIGKLLTADLYCTQKVDTENSFY